MISREEQRISIYNRIEKGTKVLDRFVEATECNYYNYVTLKATATNLVRSINVFDAISRNLPLNPSLKQELVDSARLLSNTFLSVERPN